MRELLRRRFHVPLFAPRRLGWWLMVGVSGLGLYTLGETFTRATQVYPAVLPTAIVLSIPLAAVWLVLLRLPQLWFRIARSGALAAAVWGGLAATGAYAADANAAIVAILGQYGSIELAQEWGAAVAAPVVEETAKAFAIGVVLLASAQRLRSAADAALIGAFSGLGFTIAEDMLYAFNFTGLNLGENPVQSATMSFMLRAVLFGTVSHVLFSAAVGAGIGMLITGRSRVLGLCWVGVGIGLHWLWNSPLLVEVWMRVVFCVVMPLIAWALIHHLRRHEAAWFARVMAAPGALGEIPAVYLAAMAPTWRRRRAHRRVVVRKFGFRALEPQRLLEARLSDLADALDSGDESGAAAIRADVMARMNGATTAP